MTTLRLTLRLGVSSPAASVKSLGSTAKRLMVSYEASLALSAAKSFLSSACSSAESAAGVPLLPKRLTASSDSVTSAMQYGRRSP